MHSDGHVCIKWQVDHVSAARRNKLKVTASPRCSGTYGTLSCCPTDMELEVVLISKHLSVLNLQS